MISMDKSRGSSCEALSGCKRRREDSPASAVELELEASLRSKLESEQAAREQAARAREAWAPGLERVKEGVTGSGLQGSGSGPSPSPVVDPWEAAVASGGGMSSSSASLRRPRPGPYLPPHLALLGPDLAFVRRLDPSRGRRVGRLVRFLGMGSFLLPRRSNNPAPPPPPTATPQRLLASLATDRATFSLDAPIHHSA